MNYNKIPIFDSLTHPTHDGSWVFTKLNTNNQIDTLINDMKSYGIDWAFVVEMPSASRVLEYSAAFFSLPQCFPIFYFDPHQYKTNEEINNELSLLHSRGYYGIKIHPRLSEATIVDPNVIHAVKMAEQYQLIVMLCSYFYDSKPYSLDNNEETLRSFLIQTNGTKIILLHGGLVKVLDYMELIKPFPNVLLDLSYTWMKYQETSLEQDFIYLFKHFDRRICIGSDTPDYSLTDFKKRFEIFCSYDIALEKLENVAYKNLLEWVEQIKGIHEA